MMITSQYDSERFRQRLVELQNMACENFDDLMSEIGLDLIRQGKKHIGVCPVHGGDNPTALNVYADGTEIKGIWRCRTHNCHMLLHPGTNRLMYGQTMLGLIRGVIHNRTGEYPPLSEAVNVLLKFCSIGRLDEIAIPDDLILTKRRMNNAFRRLNMLPGTATTTWTRPQVRNMLDIPAQYYQYRGYSQETLDKYDIGCYNAHNRVVTPVYDDEYTMCVGFTGRSLFDKCKQCGYYHSASEQCPQTSFDKLKSVKWKNSEGFDSRNYLYNYWFAKDHILETGCVILVEGPGDVWRLEEAGIKNSVALFGTSLTEEQRIILERSGTMSVILMLDNDQAGIDGTRIIKGQLERQFRLFFPMIDSDDDIGSLHTDVVTSDVKPLIDNIISYYRS